MKKKGVLRVLCLCAALALPFSAPALALTTGAPSSLDPSPSYAAGAEELWEQFYDAEAGKKLVEFQLEPLQEQIRLLEHSANYALHTGLAQEGASYSDAYRTWLDLKNQAYALETRKEQYELIKKNAEYQLTLLGEIQKPHEIKYELYSSGTSTWSVEDLPALQSEKASLRLEEEQLELQKKSLEYQYRLGQVGEDDFLRQFKEILRQKDSVKRERERLEAELSLMTELFGPAGSHAGPAGPHRDPGPCPHL